MSEKRQAEEKIITSYRYKRIKLASPSPERSGGSDTESIHSCQGYETELAKDTSDTSSSPTYNIEYEVIDAEEPKTKFYLSDDTDDQNNVQLDLVFDTVAHDNLDNALLGDTSEENSTSPTSNSDVDPGLPRNDYLDFENCLLCQTDKKDISYPYCSSCFSWKKNLFPSRPRNRQKILKRFPAQPIDSSRDFDSSNTSAKIDFGGSQNKNVKDNFDEVLFEDSGVGSSEPPVSEDVVDSPLQEPSTGSLSQEPSTCSLSQEPSTGSLSEEPSTGSLSQEPSTGSFSQEPSTGLLSQESSLTSRRLSLDMCRVCFSKPENGLFIHLNIAHVYGCYSCAKKIWLHGGSCPICRRKIFKVVKLFV